MNNEIKFDPTKPFGYAYDDPNNPYGWPYSARCPECRAMGMEGDKCKFCGEDQHPEQCPKCGAWQNHRHFEKYGGFGCVNCTPEKLYIERQKEQQLNYEERQRKHINDFGNKAMTVQQLRNFLDDFDGGLPIYSRVDSDWVGNVEVNYDDKLRGKYISLES